jgi:hypothetical protein
VVVGLVQETLTLFPRSPIDSMFHGGVTGGGAARGNSGVTGGEKGDGGVSGGGVPMPAAWARIRDSNYWMQETLPRAAGAATGVRTHRPRTHGGHGSRPKWKTVIFS